MSVLEVKNLHKRFENLVVLDGVDLSVEKGDVVTILGPSGSGKTTLLRCINFLETADQGTMVFDGKTYDLAAISRGEKSHIRMRTALYFRTTISSATRPLCRM